MSLNREPDCVEMKFVIDATPAAAPANPNPAQAPPRAAVQAPAPEEGVNAPDLLAVPERPKKKAIAKQKTEPAPIRPTPRAKSRFSRSRTCVPPI
jgi:hypothetical protein